MTNWVERGDDNLKGDGRPPPEVILEIADEVPPEHRDAIKASVATLARRSAATSRAAFERRKARDELMTAITRPLRNLIEEDADASKAIAALTRDRSDRPELEPAWPTVEVVEPWSQGAAAGSFADQVFVLPFQFKYRWHDFDPPDTDLLDLQTGRIRLEATIDGENRSLSAAHAGFGVVLTSNTVKAVVGRSVRKTQYRYKVDSDWFHGMAFVEGAMEMTAFENGNLLPHPPAADKLFHAHVTTGSEDEVGFDGLAIGNPIDVGFIMHPGRTYILNVGAWLTVQAQNGFAQARINAFATAITTFVTE